MHIDGMEIYTTPISSSKFQVMTLNALKDFVARSIRTRGMNLQQQMEVFTDQEVELLHLLDFQRAGSKYILIFLDVRLPRQC